MPINKIRHFSYLLMIFGAFCTDHLQASKFTEVLEVASKKLVNYNKQYAWRDNQVHSYTKDNFELLLENKIPAVKISNFLSSKESKSLATLIKKNGFSQIKN